MSLYIPLDFIDLFKHNLHKDGRDENIVQREPVDLIEIAKLALAKGELEIAENTLVEIMRSVMLDDFSKERNPESYLYLAEILERKSEDKNLEMAKKQRLILQAASLYHYVCNCLKTVDVESEMFEEVKKLSEIASRRLLVIQDNMIRSTGGDPDRCRFDWQRRRNELENLRNEVKKSLESMNCPKNQESFSKIDVQRMLKLKTGQIRKLSDTLSASMKHFLVAIIDECLELLGTAPCDFEVIVFGSLARNEMTPYSDFEWAILTNSEEEECKVFFRNLTNLVHLQIINLGETILPSMNIEALAGGWFYDDITPKGISFDGFLPQACKTPLGNMQDFELIHTPEIMGNFQNNDWYQNNWTLADTLLTFSPLQSDKHALADAYRSEVAKILSGPCDSEFCDHDASCLRPTRGTCRGITTLNKDLSRYGDGMMGKYDLDDGKKYDLKKEIYRLIDRVFSALAKCYSVDDGGTFAILDELCKRGIISPEARDNFASASAIAIKLRLTTYLNLGKQGERLVTSSDEDSGKLASVYRMPKDEELFHFFFIAIPLYEELLQRFKTADNIPHSLSNRSFFDDSEGTMGHVYCRLLNYSEALKCYERALQRNPENLSIQIRRIRISHFVTENVENAGETRKNLNTVLSKITQSFLPSGADHNMKPMEETVSFLNFLDVEDCRQLLEVLLFASQFYDCRKYFTLAEKIQAQCMAAQKNNRSSAQLLMMKFAFFNFYTNSFVDQYKIDVVVSEFISFIDAEGVSTRSIVWLNKLGEFLFSQGEYEKAYRCFQRALSMERFLYGTNPNGNMMITLRFLGIISMYLFMYMESKFYFKLLLQLFEFFGGPTAKLTVKNTYLQLALLSVAMECPAEETVCYLQNGLKVTTDYRNDTELTLDCCLHCQLSTAWHLQKNLDQALKCAFDGEACLKDIAGTPARVTMTCLLAMTFDKISETNEGIEILKNEIQELNLQSQMNQKAFCMMCLGKILAGQGLAPDARKYYKEALDVLIDKMEDKNIWDILECLIGISGAIIMEGKSSESKIFLDKAFSFAKNLPGSGKKISILKEIGKLYESIHNVNSALQCYEEALRTCKESHIAKSLPFAEFNLEVKLGEMANKDNSIYPEIEVPLEQRIQAQRIHYDRAADVLRKHVMTGQVDSTTVVLFIFLALEFKSIDLSHKIKLLLEALKIGEIVYGTNTPHEMLTTILGQLSDTYWMAGDKQAATRYRELQLKMELKLHLSDPFHIHISHTLTSLSLCFLETPSGDDAIQSTYESLMLAQKGKRLENTASEATAARCFTSLSVLFYFLNDVEKAKALNEMASKIFCQIHESVESEDLLSKKTCDIMRKILMNLQMTQKISPSHKLELSMSIFEVFSTDNGIAIVEEDLLKKAMVLRQYGGFENSPSTNQKRLQRETCNEHTTTSTDSRCDPENLNLHVPSSLPGSDCVKLDANISSDPNVRDSLAQSLSELRFPLTLQSLPDALVNPESIKSTNDYFEKKLDDIESKLPILATLSDSLEYNRKIGNDQQVAKIDASIQSQVLSFYENCAFDGGEKLISDAVKEKEKNNAYSAIRFLDLALQLPSNSKRKSQILKLRGECFLSMGYYRTAAVAFTKASSLYTSETVEKRDELCEYLAVLIGLIKSEMLCKNVEAAWLFCQDGIKLVSERELTETIQAVELFYHGARCEDILSESKGSDDTKLSHASSLCQQALTCSQSIAERTNAAGDLLEELGSSEHGKLFALKCEVQLLLAAVLQKLGKKEQAKPILEEMKEFLKNIVVVFESSDASSIGESDAEFIKISRRLYSWIGRVLVMCDDMILSISRLSKSLLAFFSTPLPDVMSVYEELVPLLQAVADSKSNASHEGDSAFQQAIDMCKDMSRKHGKDLNTIYTVLKDLVDVYTIMGRTKEAIIVAEAGLAISDLMCGINVNERVNNRCRMLLYLAQIHHLNSTNPAFDRDKELHLAEQYYLTDHDSTEDFAIRKDLSYANFLFDQKRFAEADSVLIKIESLGEQMWQKFLFCSYSSRALYGTGVRKSVEDHGEQLATIGDIMYSTKVRVLVKMGKKKEAVAACETLTAKSAVVFRDLIGKRPSCTPYLIEACHHELLTLVIDEERKQFQSCQFPLSANDLATLYCYLNEYSSALKYCTNEEESTDLIEMKITCFHKIGNELVEMNRGDESYPYFTSFLALLQRKEKFLDNSFLMECATLGKYYFTNQFYVFRSLGKMQCERGNLDVAIHCYERCLDLDEDLTCDQNIVATLADLYQTKAFTADIENQNLFEEYMNLALDLFQKLLQKTTELTAFVECAFASLLSRLEHYTEAIVRFENVLKRTDKELVSFSKEDGPLLDVYLRRELEASIGINITIPTKVLAFYELILVHMKLNEVETAQTIAYQFENDVGGFWLSPFYSLSLALVGYAYQQIGDKEKAAEIFVSVLEIIPEHLPVSEALERCCL